MLCIALFSFVVMHAQSHQDQVKSDFSKYANALKSRQYTQATTYMPDDLFAVYSKEKLVQGMKQTFESADTKVQINSVEITQIDPIINVEGKGAYIPFQFHQKFELQYVNLFDATDDEQSRASTTRFIVDMLNESIPDSTIGFNDKAEVFTIDSVKEAVALKENGATSWKFVVIEPSLSKLLGTLLPQPVIQKMNL